MAALLLVACGEPPYDQSSASGAGDSVSSSSGVGGAGGAGGQGGAGGAPCDAECLVVEDCVGLDPDLYAECGGVPACLDGACTYVFVSDVTPLDDTKGDCMRIECSDGDSIVFYDETDPEDDGNPCKLDVCVGIYETWHAFAFDDPSWGNTQGMPCEKNGMMGTCNYGDCEMP